MHEQAVLGIPGSNRMWLNAVSFGMRKLSTCGRSEAATGRSRSRHPRSPRVLRVEDLEIVRFRSGDGELDPNRAVREADVVHDALDQQTEKDPQEQRQGEPLRSIPGEGACRRTAFGTRANGPAGRAMRRACRWPAHPGTEAAPACARRSCLGQGAEIAVGSEVSAPRTQGDGLLTVSTRKG